MLKRDNLFITAVSRDFKHAVCQAFTSVFYSGIQKYLVFILLGEAI